MSWVLVANRTGARILDKQGSALSLVETVNFAEGRLRDREVESDEPGRSYDRATAARHALEQSEGPHERAAKTFANILADKLKRARLEGHFERLVLVAEPHFLGLLREALDTQTARAVIASVTKDLVHVADDEIVAHLPPLPNVVQ